MAARVKRELAADHSRDEVVSCCFQLPCALLSESKSLPISHPPWADSPSTRIRSRLARATSPPARRSATGLSAPGRSARLRRVFCAPRQAFGRHHTDNSEGGSGASRRTADAELPGRWISFTRWCGCSRPLSFAWHKSRDTLESLQSRLKTGAPKSNHVAPPDGLTLMRVLY